MRYTLRQLEIFVAISRLDSVSRASELLHLSQSATSTSLGGLERQFGLQLFDRIGKSLSINESGKKLLPKAIELLDRAKEIESELSGLAGLGEINIGATLTIGNYLTNLLVAKFLQTYPGSNIKLQVQNTKTIIQKIINRYGEITTNERVPCALRFTFGLSYDLTQILLLQRDDDERASERASRAHDERAGGVRVLDPRV